MRNATLVWSSKQHSRNHILVWDNSSYYNASKLINDIFHVGRTCRLTIKNGRYFYQPTDDYKNYVTRIRKIH